MSFCRMAIAGAVASALLFMVVSCTWIGPEREWNNPHDTKGTNKAASPVITKVMPDTVVAINDSLLMVVEAQSEGTYPVAGFCWSFDDDARLDTTIDGFIVKVWGVEDTGKHTVRVAAFNHLDMLSDPDSFLVTVRSMCPVIKVRPSDTLVSQRAVVEKELVAVDSNGTVETILWGTAESGWIDSVQADSSGRAVATFSNPEGGEVVVVWAARDDDGLMAFDTFDLMFNRGPHSAAISGEKISFVSFDIIRSLGSLRFSFSAQDPDSASDTLAYTFFIGTSFDDTLSFYSGRDTFVLVDSVSAVTKYLWQLTATDIFGDTACAQGEITTPAPPMPPEGMVLIESAGAVFQMGQSGFDGFASPIHFVSFSHHFWMDSTEVTAEEFNRIIGVAPEGELVPGLPAVNVSWFDAVLFCNAKSLEEGRDTAYSYEGRTGTAGNGVELSNVSLRHDAAGYRLPTEAEWEYACRIDSITLYFWGNDNGIASSYAWTRENSSGELHPVAMKLPNRLGLYDMAGNAWEWCNDWYDPAYYASSAPVDPKGPAEGNGRLIRGGSWKHTLYFAQAGTRGSLDPSASDNSTGFRTVLTVR